MPGKQPARLTKEELLARAKKPSADALRLHPLYKGKMQTLPKCPVRGFDAQEQGVARLSKSKEDLYEDAAKVMGQAREATRLLMREGLIPAPPETPR